ncbi:hypothetical protein GCM10027614_14210 [Micromonospora vulcania]
MSPGGWPADDVGAGRQWQDWLDAVDELGADPSVEAFEEVVAAAVTLLAALTPPPGSRRPRPNRLAALVERWGVHVDAIPRLSVEQVETPPEDGDVRR